MLHELVYRSLAKQGINQKDIENILTTSRNFNVKNEITGCLVYHKKQFIQLLEGDKKIVKQLYAGIEKDQRHYHVILLSEDDQDMRIFTEWSMAFYEPNEGQMEAMGEYLFKENLFAFSMLEDKPTETIKLFWRMIQQLLEK